MLKIDLDDYCESKVKKNSVMQQGCVSQGCNTTIPTTPPVGYMLLLEKKQANGPSLPPLISCSATILQCGVKRGLEGQNQGKDDVPSQNKHLSSCSHSPLKFKQLATENSTFSATENLSYHQLDFLSHVLPQPGNCSTSAAQT